MNDDSVHGCIQQLVVCNSKQGWLSRRNKHTKIVTTRYMILDGFLLYSFRKCDFYQPPLKSQATTIYDFTNCNITCEWKGSAYHVTIEGGSLKTQMIFYFTTLQSAQDWCNAFSRASALGAIALSLKDAGYPDIEPSELNRLIGVGVTHFGIGLPNASRFQLIVDPPLKDWTLPANLQPRGHLDITLAGLRNLKVSTGIYAVFFVVEIESTFASQTLSPSDEPPAPFRTGMIGGLLSVNNIKNSSNNIQNNNSSENSIHICEDHHNIITNNSDKNNARFATESNATLALSSSNLSASRKNILSISTDNAPKSLIFNNEPAIQERNSRDYDQINSLAGNLVGNPLNISKNITSEENITHTPDNTEHTEILEENIHNEDNSKNTIPSVQPPNVTWLSGQPILRIPLFEARWHDWVLVHIYLTPYNQRSNNNYTNNDYTIHNGVINSQEGNIQASNVHDKDNGPTSANKQNIPNKDMLNMRSSIGQTELKRHNNINFGLLPPSPMGPFLEISAFGESTELTVQNQISIYVGTATFPLKDAINAKMAVHLPPLSSPDLPASNSLSTSATENNLLHNPTKEHQSTASAPNNSSGAPVSFRHPKFFAPNPTRQPASAQQLADFLVQQHASEMDHMQHLSPGGPINNNNNNTFEFNSYAARASPNFSSSHLNANILSNYPTVSTSPYFSNFASVCSIGHACLAIDPHDSLSHAALIAWLTVRPGASHPHRAARLVRRPSGSLIEVEVLVVATLSQEGRLKASSNSGVAKGIMASKYVMEKKNSEDLKRGGTTKYSAYLNKNLKQSFGSAMKLKLTTILPKILDTSTKSFSKNTQPLTVQKQFPDLSIPASSVRTSQFLSQSYSRTSFGSLKDLSNFALNFLLEPISEPSHVARPSINEVKPVIERMYNVIFVRIYNAFVPLFDLWDFEDSSLSILWMIIGTFIIFFTSLTQFFVIVCLLLAYMVAFQHPLALGLYGLLLVTIANGIIDHAEQKHMRKIAAKSSYSSKHHHQHNHNRNQNYRSFDDNVNAASDAPVTYPLHPESSLLIRARRVVDEFTKSCWPNPATLQTAAWILPTAWSHKIAPKCLAADLALIHKKLSLSQRQAHLRVKRKLAQEANNVNNGGSGYLLGSKYSKNMVSNDASNANHQYLSQQELKKKNELFLPENNPTASNETIYSTSINTEQQISNAIQNSFTNSPTKIHLEISGNPVILSNAPPASPTHFVNDPEVASKPSMDLSYFLLGEASQISPPSPLLIAASADTSKYEFDRKQTEQASQIGLLDSKQQISSNQYGVNINLIDTSRENHIKLEGANDDSSMAEEDMSINFKHTNMLANGSKSLLNRSSESTLDKKINQKSLGTSAVPSTPLKPLNVNEFPTQHDAALWKVPSVLWEIQSRGIFSSFVSPGLSDASSTSYVDDTGNRALPVGLYVNVDPAFKLEWVLDFELEPIDIDGWQYGIVKRTTTWSSHCSRRSYLRRRRWISSLIPVNKSNAKSTEEDSFSRLISNDNTNKIPPENVLSELDGLSPSKNKTFTSIGEKQPTSDSHHLNPSSFPSDPPKFNSDETTNLEMNFSSSSLPPTTVDNKTPVLNPRFGLDRRSSVRSSVRKLGGTLGTGFLTMIGGRDAIHFEGISSSSSSEKEEEEESEVMLRSQQDEKHQVNYQHDRNAIISEAKTAMELQSEVTDASPSTMNTLSRTDKSMSKKRKASLFGTWVSSPLAKAVSSLIGASTKDNQDEEERNLTSAFSSDAIDGHTSNRATTPLLSSNSFPSSTDVALTNSSNVINIPSIPHVSRVSAMERRRSALLPMTFYPRHKEAKIAKINRRKNELNRHHSANVSSIRKHKHKLSTAPLNTAVLHTNDLELNDGDNPQTSTVNYADNDNDAISLATLSTSSLESIMSGSEIDSDFDSSEESSSSSFLAISSDDNHKAPFAHLVNISHSRSGVPCQMKKYSKIMRHKSSHPLSTSSQSFKDSIALPLSTTFSELKHNDNSTSLLPHIIGNLPKIQNNRSPRDAQVVVDNLDIISDSKPCEDSDTSSNAPSVRSAPPERDTALMHHHAIRTRRRSSTCATELVPLKISNDKDCITFESKTSSDNILSQNAKNPSEGLLLTTWKLLKFPIKLLKESLVSNPTVSATSIQPLPLPELSNNSDEQRTTENEMSETNLHHQRVASSKKDKYSHHGRHSQNSTWSDGRVSLISSSSSRSSSTSSSSSNVAIKYHGRRLARRLQMQAAVPAPYSQPPTTANLSIETTVSNERILPNSANPQFLRCLPQNNFTSQPLSPPIEVSALPHTIPGNSITSASLANDGVISRVGSGAIEHIDDDSPSIISELLADSFLEEEDEHHNLSFHQIHEDDNTNQNSFTVRAAINNAVNGERNNYPWAPSALSSAGPLSVTAIAIKGSSSGLLSNPANISDSSFEAHSRSFYQTNGSLNASLSPTGSNLIGNNNKHQEFLNRSVHQKNSLKPYFSNEYQTLGDIEALTSNIPGEIISSEFPIVFPKSSLSYPLKNINNGISSKHSSQSETNFHASNALWTFGANESNDDGIYQTKRNNTHIMRSGSGSVTQNNNYNNTALIKNGNGKSTLAIGSMNSNSGIISGETEDFNNVRNAEVSLLNKIESNSQISKVDELTPQVNYTLSNKRSSPDDDVDDDDDDDVDDIILKSIVTETMIKSVKSPDQEEMIPSTLAPLLNITSNDSKPKRLRMPTVKFKFNGAVEEAEDEEDAINFIDDTDFHTPSTSRRLHQTSSMLSKEGHISQTSSSRASPGKASTSKPNSWVEIIFGAPTKAGRFTPSTAQDQKPRRDNNSAGQQNLSRRRSSVSLSSRRFYTRSPTGTSKNDLATKDGQNSNASIILDDWIPDDSSTFLPLRGGNDEKSRRHLKPKKRREKVASQRLMLDGQNNKGDDKINFYSLEEKEETQLTGMKETDDVDDDNNDHNNHDRDIFTVLSSQPGNLKNISRNKSSSGGWLSFFTGGYLAPGNSNTKLSTDRGEGKADSSNKFGNQEGNKRRFWENGLSTEEVSLGSMFGLANSDEDGWELKGGAGTGKSGGSAGLIGTIRLLVETLKRSQVVIQDWGVFFERMVNIFLWRDATASFVLMSILILIAMILPFINLRFIIWWKFISDFVRGYKRRMWRDVIRNDIAADLIIAMRMAKISKPLYALDFSAQQTLKVLVNRVFKLDLPLEVISSSRCLADIVEHIRLRGAREGRSAPKWARVDPMWNVLMRVPNDDFDPSRGRAKPPAVMFH